MAGGRFLICFNSEWRLKSSESFQATQSVLGGKKLPDDEIIVVEFYSM